MTGKEQEINFSTNLVQAGETVENRTSDLNQTVSQPLPSDEHRVRQLLAGMQRRLNGQQSEWLTADQDIYNEKLILSTLKTVRWIHDESTALHLRELRELSRELEALLRTLAQRHEQLQLNIVQAVLKGLSLLRKLMAGIKQALDQETKILSCSELPQVTETIRNAVISLYSFEETEETNTRGVVASNQTGIERGSVLPVDLKAWQRLGQKVTQIFELNESNIELSQKPALNALVLRDHLRHMNFLLQDLQKNLDSMRKVKLRPFFKMLHGLVRTLSTKRNKQVRLSTIGADLQVDRYIVDRMREPIIHLIYNAIDHGIESTAERLRKGKLAQANITFRVFVRNDQLVCEVSDDGSGVDYWAVMTKALEKNMIPHQSKASEAQVYHWMFQSGLSTSSEQAEYPERGMGLGIVKRNVESLNGTVQVRSSKDRGCSFVISIPIKEV